MQSCRRKVRGIDPYRRKLCGPQHKRRKLVSLGYTALWDKGITL